MNTQKKSAGIAFAAIFALFAFAGVAQAAGSYVSSIDYSYSSDSGTNNKTTSNSSYVSSIDYTYPTTNTKNGGNYSGGCCKTNTTTTKSSPSYVSSIDYTYKPTYTTTPTYTTPTYTPPTYTYNPPTYSQPTCAIAVNKTSITAGQSVTVSWSSTHANSGSISNLGSNLPASGSHAVTLGNTTTFSGTFVGQGGIAYCSKTVTVTQVTPTCTISGPATAVAGQSITLNWSSTNAQYGNILNLGSNLPPSGSHTFVIGNTTTFSGTFYASNGQTATCQKTITVSQPTPAPTCSMNGNPTTIAPGQSSTLSWNSSNVSSVSINNIGSSLSANGSQVVYPSQTTTYTGTFIGNNGQQVTCSQTIVVTPVQYCPAGYTGTYPNCVPLQHNNPSCSITINNYNGNNYFQPNQAVTISWSSANASWGTINNGLGSVNLSGTRTVYPTQTTTYTGTFYGHNGQSVTCSATVYVNGYVPPVNPGTPFITLSAVPYTGLELGPVGTVLYWAFIALWCALAAYLIVVKKVQNQVYDSLMSILFGKAGSPASVAHAGQVHASYTTPVVRVEDKTDDFILSQINRTR